MASYVLADLSGHCERELFFIFFVAMAESEGPSVTPPRKKPKRQQSHFDASWIVPRDRKVKWVTIISLMMILMHVDMMQKN